MTEDSVTLGTTPPESTTTSNPVLDRKRELVKLLTAKRKARSDRKLLDFVPTLIQKLVLLAKEKIVLVLGSNRCIGGMEAIYDPVAKCLRRIDSITEPFHVYAWDGEAVVIAAAGIPFQKGSDRLKRYSFSHGPQLCAFGTHRVLAHGVYQPIGDELNAVFSVLPESILDTVPLTLCADVQRWWKRVRDFLWYYSVCSYLYDAQFPSVKDIVQDVVPFSSDAHTHIFCEVCERKDAQDNTLRHTHPCLSNVLPSNLDDLQLTSGQFVDILFRIFDKLLKLTEVSPQAVHLSTRAYDLLQSMPEFVQRDTQTIVHSSDAAISSSTPLLSSSIITNIEEIGVDVKWDFEVEGYANYIHKGLIHHNSGKSEIIAVDSLLRLTGIIPEAIKDEYPKDYVYSGEAWLSGMDFVSLMGIVKKKIDKFLPARVNGGYNKEAKIQKFTTSSEIQYKCHARGQRVLMADSTLKDIFDVDVGEYVRCADGSVRRVNSVFRYPKAEVLNIEAKGHSLRVTPHHRLFVEHKGWVLATQIVEGDVLQCCHCAGGTDDVAIWKPYVLALMITEGCTRGKSPDFTTASQEVLTAVSTVLPNDIFIKKVSETYAPYGYRLSSKTQYSNRIKIYLQSVGLWNKLSYDKFIPPEVFTWSNQCKKKFLEMLFACDGCVTKLDARYTTASPQLARDVQALLWSFNIHAELRQVNAKHYYLIISSENRVKFNAFDIIGKPAKYHPKFRRPFKKDGTVLSKKRHTKKVEVCCLEIDGTHEMIVEGVRSHNSYDQGREKFQGTSKNYVSFDEEPPQDVYDEGYMRTVDCSGLIRLAFTPLKGLTWAYNSLFKKAHRIIYTENIHGIPEKIGIVHTPDEIKLLKDRRIITVSQHGAEIDPDIVVFQMAIYDNPHLPEAEIWKAEKKYADDPSSYNARILGRFTTITGRNVFDTDTLLRRQPNCPKPYAIGEIVNGQFQKSIKGRLVIFKDLKDLHDDEYVVGADVAEGLEIGDFSCAQVLSKRTGEQVAVWHGKCSPEEFTGILISIGKFFRMADLAPERNFHGFAVVTRLKEHYRYPNLYSEYDASNLDKVSSGKSTVKRYGWDTNSKTKPLMIQELAMFIREGHLKLNDVGTIEELITYVYDKDGKTEAMNGCYDDKVMALAIALQVFLKRRLLRRPVVTINPYQRNRITGY